jgi:hypothetical protein
MASFPVKWFTNSQGGAPTLEQYSVGSLISVLRACLVDGYNLTAVPTMTYDGGSNSVTADFGVSHGFVKHQVIEITGADQSEYNGQFRVTVAGGTSLSFTPVR